MADRSVNVNINYKVNTVEVQAAEAQVKRAQQATNQLQQATQQFGAKGSAAFRSTATSISGMEMELERLRNLIKLTSTSDTQRLQQLSAQYKQAKAQLDAYKKSLLDTNKASSQAATHTRDIARNLRDLYTAAKLMVAARLAKEILDISIAAARLSGNLVAVETAFRHQVTGSEELLIRLRNATHGAVSDLELMQQTLQAQFFGIDVQRLPELLEFAAVRAQQTGQSVDYMVQSIVLGLGRKSLLVLDNLGISSSRLKEEFKGVSLNALSVAEVTQGVSNIMREEMQKMGGYVETSATKVDRLTVSWKKFMEQLAIFATEGPAGGVVGVADSYVNTFRRIVESWNRGISVSQLVDEERRKEIASISAAEFQQRVLNKSKEENIELLEAEIQRLTRSIGSWASMRDVHQEVIDSHNAELKAIDEKVRQSGRITREQQLRVFELRNQIDLRKNLIDVNKDDVLIDQEILKLLQSRLQVLKKINKEEGGDNVRGLLQEKQDELERLQEELKSTRDLGDLGPEGRIVKDIQRVQQEIDFLLGKSKKSAEKWQEDYEKIIHDWAKSYLKTLEERDKRELQSLKNSNDLAEYYHNLRTQKEREAEEERWAIAEDNARRRRDLQEEIFALSERLLGATVELITTTNNSELDAIRKKYDEQIQLAGDNERAQMELRIKRDRELAAAEARQKQADKQAAVTRLIIDGLVAIGKIFAQFGWPGGIVPAGIMAAITATNVATVRKLKKGEIDIKGGKQGEDSIPALLMPGESVMTREETKDSRNILKAIRAKKLNDQVLKDIVSGRSGGTQVKNIFDDSKIVKEIRDLKNSQGDIVERHGLIMKAQRKSETYTRYVRIKTFGKF